MQPTLTKQITTEGHLSGKVTQMGVQAKDMAHVMHMLTNIYSDPIMAVLREYSANARDEHTLLGLDRPIEVTLPNRFNSNLVVKDYGRGMSIDFVEQRYSQYGDSAKRDDPNQIGGYGIGGKSALAYTDSFTLTTVKDGIKGVFVISRDAGGTGSIKTIIPGGTLTSEENYTEIKVPAKGENDFTEKAKFLFKFWPEGSVIVNGEKPVRFSGQPVGDDLWYSRGAGQSYLVMGGIPYRVANPSRFLTSHYLNNFHFIANVGIEEATVTPSREDLEYDTITMETLRRVGSEFEKRFIAMATKEILDQPTHETAFSKWREWKGSIPGTSFDNLTYKGDLLVDSMPVEGVVWKRNAYRYEGNHHNIKNINTSSLKNYAFITGREDVNSSYTKARVRRYLEAKMIHGITHAVFVDEFPTTVWGKPLNITWSEILTVKPPAIQRGAGTYAIIGDRGHVKEVTVDELKDWDSKLILITPKRWRTISHQGNLIQLLTTLGADVTLVKLAESRWPKFKRTFKDVDLFETWIKDFLAVCMAEIPQTTWELKSIGSTGRWIINRLDVNKIDDPELKKIVAIDKDDKHEAVISNIVRAASISIVPVTLSKSGGDDWFAEKYPLIVSFSYYNVNMEELTIYLNAAYAARKDK